MSIAQTAQLIVEIIGKDMLTPAVASAESGLSSMSGMSLTAAKSASTAEKALGLVGSAASGMGNALNHAKGFVSNLVSGPLGMIGLGVAAFSVAGALKETIGTANDLAAAIEKLAPLTGDSAEQLSGLLAVFNKFGISTDTAVTRLAFMEKAVGTLTLTTATAAKFQKEFGVSLVDASGHVKDANTLLALAADYWTGTASAAEKAAFEAKLFGRGFADMIPILNLGSKGLLDAEAAAAALGLTLNATNVADLQKYQESMREAGDAIGGLKLQIALALIPTITELATSIRTFVTDHRTDLVSFFKGALASAKEIGGALVSVGKAAAGVWNSIPGPLRDLLVQALIGNKVIKTVFGINILGTVEGAVANIGKNLLSSVAGSLFGKTIATPVVNVDGAVVNVGGVGGALAGAGGALGGGEAAAGGAGVLETIGGAGFMAVIAPLAVAAAVPLILNQIANGDPAKTGANDLAARQAIAAGRGLNPANVPTSITGRLSAAPGAGPNYGAAVANLASTEQATQALAASSWQKAINIWNGVQATLKAQLQAQEHGAAIKAIQATGETMHQFLLAFRTGSAKVAIMDFPKELNYLSTASDAQKKTAVYASGLRQDITALQKAEVGATDAQKIKLAAEIVTLQALVKATTAAVNSGLSVTMIGGRLDELNPKPVKVNVTVKTSTTSAAKAKTTAKSVGAKGPAHA